MTIILFHFRRENAAKKNQQESNFVLYRPDFCENHCTYGGTDKLCTSNDKHQPTLTKKKGMES